MPLRYLVDVNLPRNFSFFKSEAFIHVADVNPRLTDREIWDYALKSDLIILTKDVDFYSRHLLAKQRPAVVYFKRVT
jgi:predicted nuclease of predicted toxin-antitoxin system